MELSDTFPFGKYKGVLVADAIVKDPGYFVWLRNQRWTSEPAVYDAGFSDQIHELMEDWLALPSSQSSRTAGPKTRAQHIFQHQRKMEMFAKAAQAESGEGYAAAHEEPEAQEQTKEDSPASVWGAWG